MTLIENEDMIQAFAADTPQKAFTDGIGFGSADGRPQGSDATRSALELDTSGRGRESRTEGVCRKALLRAFAAQPTHRLGGMSRQNGRR
ncbi:MAG: hypothetical protein ABI700_07900, partial [Chloroflexota bacterium]